jgi:hypothetical protein
MECTDPANVDVFLKAVKNNGALLLCLAKTGAWLQFLVDDLRR